MTDQAEALRASGEPVPVIAETRGVSRATLYRTLAEIGDPMIPANLVEQLSTALARWDGRGSTADDTLEAGKALASAAMVVLNWDAPQ
jgi:hypothetical protein